MRRYRKILTVLVLFSCMILVACIERTLTGQLTSQQLASRWSKEEEFAQISCYFSKDAGMTKDQIAPLERQIQEALKEAASEDSDAGGRTWADAYSTEGQLTITSDRTSATVRAFGVAGDFFLFHPMKLLSGNYFGLDDVNEDGVILDENVAWQLFGSYNVAGMTVEIGNNAYPIRGVVRSDSGLFSKAAEEEASTIYVSYAILEQQMGGEIGIDSYELLVANPVHEFGVSSLKNALGIEESKYELVENSARFDLKHRLLLLKNFGIRSMNTKGIIYPYWENRARGYEDISALLLAIEILLLLYPLFYLLRRLHWLWKHKEKGKAFLKEKLDVFWKNFSCLLKKTVKTYKVVNKKKME